MFSAMLPSTPLQWCSSLALFCLIAAFALACEDWVSSFVKKVYIVDVLLDIHLGEVVVYFGASFCYVFLDGCYSHKGMGRRVSLSLGTCWFGDDALHAHTDASSPSPSH